MQPSIWANKTCYFDGAVKIIGRLIPKTDYELEEKGVFSEDFENK